MLSCATDRRCPGVGDATDAVTGTPGIAGAFAGLSTVTPRMSIPLTRKFRNWKPCVPPNEKAAEPLSVKTSRTVPSNGALTLTDADGMLTSTVPSAALLNVTLP